LADTFAIVTGRSKVQTRAIADSVTEAARLNGYGVSRVEGYSDGTWILIDLGNVIVHVFTPEQREFYNLERLWSIPNAAGSIGAPENSNRRSADAARPPAEPGPPNTASSAS
jgi:ribosome-associated protein